MKKKPKYMMVYRCLNCGLDSGYTENEKPVCRHCEDRQEMKLISRKEITAKVMSDRLNELSERMYSNLQSAFEKMTDEDKQSFPKGMDAEQQMLMILAKAKKFKEHIQKLELGDSGD